MSHERAAPRAEGVFRLRGEGEITRFEGFSDAVFAFAVTLLVVSLEVPRTFNELLVVMRGFVAFAICFTMLITLWHAQHTFFRRYGLQDNTTIVLNATLLFLVLFYVYPLKFLFTLLTSQLLGLGAEVRLPDGRVEAMIDRAQVRDLMVVYGLGFVAVFLVFALLYRHAYRRRAELELDGAEVLITRGSIEAHLLTAGVGLLSILIVLVYSWEALPMAARRAGSTASWARSTLSTVGQCAPGCAGWRLRRRPKGPRPGLHEPARAVPSRTDPWQSPVRAVRVASVVSAVPLG